MRRRDFVLGGAAAGALFVATPASAFARAFLRTAENGATSRRSRLFPGDGTMVAHADLHNHTLLSDGAARAEEAFGMLRTAGMDVASLTDHTVFGSVVQDSLCDSCSPLAGIDEAGWHTHRRVADAANMPGEFVAIRGFEWTTVHLGHVNVWFSEQWIDSLTTGSLVGAEALVKVLGDADESLHELLRQLDPVVRAVPELTSIDGFYDWLSRPVSGSGFGGGGADALCGFNHPNEYGNFDQFAYFGQVSDRVVSCEMLNRYDDYLFRGTDRGEASPLNACLNAGWRVGMLGVTDEHGNQFDVREGKGRAGLWVRALTRDGVREALEARRFYATRLAGLRLDTTAGGVRMGGTIGHAAGPVRVEVDVDKGPEWYGKRLLAQVLTAGPAGGFPRVAAVHEFVVPSPSEPVVGFDVELAADETTWAVLRVSDPELPAHRLATGEYAGFGDVVAYASPWWLRPDPTVAPSAPPRMLEGSAPEMGVQASNTPGSMVTAASSSGSGAALAATGGAAVGAAGAGAATAALVARWLATSERVGLGHPHHRESTPPEYSTQ